MTFEFDASDLEEGTELVVFEECIDANSDVVAVHKDIGDAGQTVVIDNPDTLVTPHAPKPGMPKTGDNSPWIPVVCPAGAAACAAGITALASRRKEEPSNPGLTEE